MDEKKYKRMRTHLFRILGGGKLKNFAALESDYEAKLVFEIFDAPEVDIYKVYMEWLDLQES